MGLSVETITRHQHIKDSSAAAQPTEKLVGKDLPRREGYRFVQGKGEFTADIGFPNALRIAIYRSPYAHARIVEIDKSKALAIPGVVAVFTGMDMMERGLKKGRMGMAGQAQDQYPLAIGKVRYFGEPVAAVVADSQYTAEDGASAIEAKFEPLEPSLDPYKSVEGKDTSLIHEETDSNVAFQKVYTYGDVDGEFAKAQKIIKLNRLHVPRFTSAPLEPTAIQADYNWRQNSLYVIGSLKSSEATRQMLANNLGIPFTSIHMYIPDVGGSFGVKNHGEWTLLIAWIATQMKKPVKYVSAQSEMLTASQHAEEIWWDAELAVDLDGTIRGFRARCIHDQGAYGSLRGIANQLRNPAEQYRFRCFQLDISEVLTNKVPCGSNRGYAKLHHVFMLERLIDAASHELGIDPVEIRRKNLVRPDEMPYIAPNGAVYDGGDYPELLKRTMELFDYSGFRTKQAELRKQGRYIGIGVALGMESNPSTEAKELNVLPLELVSRGTGNQEAASVKIDQFGKVLVTAGDIPQGQGHEVTNAQIVADTLGMPYDDIVVTSGYDSWRDAATPFSITASCRWAVLGTGALLGASKLVREKVLRVGAYVLNSNDVDLIGGTVVDRASGNSVTVKEIARLAYVDLEKLPPGVEPGLEARYVYKAKYDMAGGRAIPDEKGYSNLSMSYAAEATFVAVEVDSETHEIKLLNISKTGDCGRQINPGVVASLEHGAIADQVGFALFMQMVYDDNGQLLTSTFKDYVVPLAADLPGYNLGHMETPSLFTPLGVKGMAEGAGTPAVATISAIEDALGPLGIRLSRVHISPSDLHAILGRKSA